MREILICSDLYDQCWFVVSLSLDKDSAHNCWFQWHPGKRQSSVPCVLIQWSLLCYMCTLGFECVRTSCEAPYLSFDYFSTIWSHTSYWQTANKFRRLKWLFHVYREYSTITGFWMAAHIIFNYTTLYTASSRHIKRCCYSRPFAFFDFLQLLPLNWLWRTCRFL